MRVAYPASSNKEHVSDLYVTALSSWANVDTLVLATMIQLFIGDGIIVEGVILNALCLGISSIIKKKAATGDSMFRPVVHGAFEVGCWT